MHAARTCTAASSSPSADAVTDALSWNSRVEGAEHLALFTSLILPRALAVFVRYPTRIAHAFGTSRRFSPDLPYAATCNRRVEPCLAGNVYYIYKTCINKHMVGRLGRKNVRLSKTQSPKMSLPLTKSSPKRRINVPSPKSAALSVCGTTSSRHRTAVLDGSTCGS